MYLGPRDFYSKALVNIVAVAVLQWNLYKADTIRSKKSVRFMEMSAL